MAPRIKLSFRFGAGSNNTIGEVIMEATIRSGVFTYKKVFTVPTAVVGQFWIVDFEDQQPLVNTGFGPVGWSKTATTSATQGS